MDKTLTDAIISFRAGGVNRLKTFLENLYPDIDHGVVFVDTDGSDVSLRAGFANFFYIECSKRVMTITTRTYVRDDEDGSYDSVDKIVHCVSYSGKDKVVA